MNFYNVERTVELARLRMAAVSNLEQFEAALADELCANAGSLPLSHCCSTGGEYVSGTAEVLSIETRLHGSKVFGNASLAFMDTAPEFTSEEERQARVDFTFNIRTGLLRAKCRLDPRGFE
jgi:hypothetical protein